VLALSLASGEMSGWSPAQLTPRGVWSLAFLVVAGTVLGFGAYTWLLRHTSPATVGTYSFVNPVVALALGWIVGDEPFSLRTIVAATIVLSAVGLIWKSSHEAGTSFRRLVPLTALSAGPSRPSRPSRLV
jgi:drug/metabolite transporter (DMT)-like permease